jgi:hypothetical protein
MPVETHHPTRWSRTATRRKLPFTVAEHGSARTKRQEEDSSRARMDLDLANILMVPSEKFQGRRLPITALHLPSLLLRVSSFPSCVPFVSAAGRLSTAAVAQKRKQSQEKLQQHPLGDSSDVAEKHNARWLQHTTDGLYAPHRWWRPPPNLMPSWGWTPGGSSLQEKNGRVRRWGNEMSPTFPVRDGHRRSAAKMLMQTFQGRGRSAVGPGPPTCHRHADPHLTEVCAVPCGTR